MSNWRRFSNFWLNRFQEPSTWRGFVLLLTALGIKVSPEQEDAILFVGLSIAGSMLVLKADPDSPDAK